MADAPNTPLLAVKDLVTRFDTDEGTLRAVDGVSFTIRAGSTLGIVGESGCGKSVTSLSILRLVPSPPGWIERGSIELEGRDLLALNEREMRAVRGRQIAMIFQEPMSSLNPVYTVGNQIEEAVRLHLGLDAAKARAKAIEMLELVGIPGAAERVDAYPHQLSGGMRQRVMIAIALACEPKLLIADEPTTALDVTIQAQILELIARLRRELGMAVLLITHDLGVVAESVDEVIVMYAGKVVERAPTMALFAQPLHPYTRGLMRSIPARAVHEGRKSSGAKRRLATIPGVVPDLRDLPKGCRFRDRCDVAIDRCAKAEPPLERHGEEREVACFVASLDESATQPPVHA